MKIEYIQVTIEVYSPIEKFPRRIRVKVKTLPFQEYGMEQIIPENDLISNFDYFFETAKREIKRVMEREELIVHD